MHELRHNEPCPHCGRFDNRGVSIDAVIIRDGKVLLIKRGLEPNKGFWATPGGYVEWDESAEQTVQREVKEETGLTTRSVRLVGVYSAPGRHPKQVINLLYVVDVEEGEPLAGDDAEGIRWFALDNLPEQLALDHKQNIADAQKALAADRL